MLRPHLAQSVARRVDHRFAYVTAAVLVLASLMLSGCNTTEGVGKDVSATGAAVTRGASDVKNGL